MAVARAPRTATRPTRAWPRSSVATTRPTCSGSTRTSSPERALTRGAGEHVGQLAPRGDVELAKRPPQVGLDRLLGDEQGLGDLAVGLTGRRKLGHPSLAWRERVGA